LNWGQSIKIKGLTSSALPPSTARGARLSIRPPALGFVGSAGLPALLFRGRYRLLFHFKEIGDALGPFDLGRPAHRLLHATLDCPPCPYLARRSAPGLDRPAAARFIGIHWGTFDLAREPYDEPLKLIAAEVERRGLDPAAVWIPKPGETVPW